MSEEVLNELQLLTAMYDPGDIQFHDEEVLNMIENCIPIADSVSLCVRVNEFLELDLRIPLGYPDSERLSAHCKISSKNPASGLDRSAVQQWESQFNNDLCQNYLRTGRESKPELCQVESEEMQPNILGLIQWCNENFVHYPLPVEQYGTKANEAGRSRNSADQDNSCRIWIYSHHIYNKNKRKFLVNTAEELGLSGFSLPGKPGFICVEGDPSNCDDYWSRVRQLTWQKISLIERQSFPTSEMIFDKKSFEELHCDKSSFIKFLEEKNASSIIKDYLGI